MAKKRKAPVAPPPKGGIKTPLRNGATWYSNTSQLVIIGFILLLTFICFSPALSSKKEFTNWDDPVYVTEQKLITKMDAANIKTIFSPKNDVSLNYHPLTVLSLAINYKFSKLNPFGYFLTNILIHLLNTFFVFIFLYRLSKKSFWVGAIGALIFGIHPMHVESVAWAAERKDVLYCFFFLASCITYLYYLETKKLEYIMFCFLFFLCSCLSKAMAAPLPFVLLLIDFYKQRKFTMKSIAEKIPFILLAVWIAYIAVEIQSKQAIADFKVFTLAQRFMFAGYGFMMYWVKLFVPIGLSTFYPYPSLVNGNIRLIGSDVPFIYNLSPFIVLAMVLIPLFFAYKKNKELFRTLLFGIGFFILMTAMVLQFISVGAAIMADRYSYLPYIGAAFILASLLNKYIERKQTKKLVMGFLLIVTPVLAIACYNRVGVWNDSGKLWTDVIEKYPYVIEQTGNVVTVKVVGVVTAYKNRGNYYREKGEMDKAFADYDLLVRAHAQDEGAYSNMGNFYGLKAQEALAKGDKNLASEHFAKALEMYSEAIKMKPDNYDAYQNRAITKSGMGDHKQALEDFQQALAIKPEATILLEKIAFERLSAGMFAESIEDCNRALAVDPANGNVLLYRGTAYVNLGKYNEAIIDISQSLKIISTNGNGWFNLSYAYNKVNNKPKALEAAINAKKNGYAVSDEYMNSLK